MRGLIRTSKLFSVAAALLLVYSSSAIAQEARSGGFDFMWGTGTSTGGEYKDRSGSMTTLEMLFSTRWDGSNTPLIVGAQFFYFTKEKGDGECIPPVTYVADCVFKFPHVAGAGIIAAFEPMITATTFVHVNGGLGIIQPSSNGGPTIAGLAAAKVGQGLSRHFAIVAGGRIMYAPDFRGTAVSIPTYTVGLRIR